LKKRGITLIEVLVAAFLCAIVAMALSTAFAVTVRHQANFERPRQDFEAIAFFEDRVRNLLTKAVYSNDTEQSTFLVGDSISGDASVSDRLVFSTLGMKPSGTIVASDDTDFENRNKTFGTVGGVTEVALSMTSVGDSGGREGLFIRKQTPADSDHTNGGFESVLSDLVADVSFEFWDSTAWVATWDTATETRLPEAIMVHYYLTADTDQEHTFVVRLPNAQGAQATTDTGGETP